MKTKWEEFKEPTPDGVGPIGKIFWSIVGTAIMIYFIWAVYMTWFGYQGTL